jgi:hypothetical protein
MRNLGRAFGLPTVFLNSELVLNETIADEAEVFQCLGKNKFVNEQDDEFGVT